MAVELSGFDALGFSWDRAAAAACVAAHPVPRACFRFHKMLAEFVWDAGVLEGNPFTFPEVQTLLDGVTVGGRKLSDQEQILNLAESCKRLLAMVKAGQFSLSKPVFTELNGIVARNEALEWGVFRGAPGLNRVFREGVAALEACPPFERARAFFLFGALRQFFFDGNKRTSRFMMNGVLMSHGIDAISVPAARAEEFNEKMARFYLSRTEPK
jgi:Fic family protein